MVTTSMAAETATNPGVEPRDGTVAGPKAIRSGRHRPRVRPYHKHGLTTLRRTVEAIGGRMLDGRTTLAKQLAAWKVDLVRDLGGDVSTQQAAIVDLAVRTKLLLDSIDAWLLVQPSLVNARKPACPTAPCRLELPVLRRRQVRRRQRSEGKEAEALFRLCGCHSTSRQWSSRRARGVVRIRNLRGPASFPGSDSSDSGAVAREATRSATAGHSGVRHR
jgi:hypothetical protein